MMMTGEAGRAEKQSSAPTYEGASFRTPRKRLRGKAEAAGVHRKGQSDTSSDGETAEGSQQDRADCVPTSISSPPPSKRRYLAGEDVGRFASMSLRSTQDRAPAASNRTTLPSEVIMPTSPPVQTRTTWYDGSLVSDTQAAEMQASAVEEPEDDIDMRERRGQHTIQMEKDRFYVTSLSDSSSDEEDSALAKDRIRVDEILGRPRGSSDDAELLRATQGQDHDDEPAYLVNGQLLSRLQLLDWQRRRGIEAQRADMRTFSPRKEEIDEDEAKDGGRSALILWRKPDDVQTDFGRKNLPARVAPVPQPLPLVHEDGAYAFVQRHTADGMDIDQ